MEPPEAFETFRDDNFLSQHLLNEKYAMEYFYTSRFFDTQSLNQKERQGICMHGTEECTLYRLTYSKQKPSSSDGLSDQQCPWNYPNQFGVFVIQKFYRDRKGAETPLESYYIFGGTIFKAPLLGTLIRRRCLSAVRHLNSLLDNVTRMSSWSLIEGRSWVGAQFPSHLSNPRDSNPSETIENDHDDDIMIDENNVLSLGQQDPNATRVFEKSSFTCVTSNPSHHPHAISEDADLYTKQPCTDAQRIIEASFSKIALSSTEFNNQVTAIRQKWDQETQNWQAQTFALSTFSSPPVSR